MIGNTVYCMQYFFRVVVILYNHFQNGLLFIYPERKQAFSWLTKRLKRNNFASSLCCFIDSLLVSQELSIVTIVVFFLVG